MTAVRDLLVMAKPIGPLCNMDCTYCYYLEKEELFKGGVKRMEDALLEKYVRERLLGGGETVHFEWHGGEPTTLGLDYFRRVVELEKKHERPGQRVTNGLQTNGLLLDEGWARFLAEARFMVGLSIDGPREMHDAYRVTKGGQGTHKDVQRAFQVLAKHGVHINVLCVVHAANVGSPREVYRYFKDLGVRFLQFLPLVERVGDSSAVTARTPAPGAFGEFMCVVMDEWAKEDVGRIALQLVEESLRPAMHTEHALCIFRETCGDVLVLEHDGEMFACDHFVDAEHRLGNLKETSLAELAEAEPARALGRGKKDDLPACCIRCDVRAYCNGGCPKDRFVMAPDGDKMVSYLCPSYLRFFRHGRPTFERLAELVQKGEPATRLMEERRAAKSAATGAAGRNDPCPCGSGKKFKKCCLAQT